MPRRWPSERRSLQLGEGADSINLLPTERIRTPDGLGMREMAMSGAVVLMAAVLLLATGWKNGAIDDALARELSNLGPRAKTVVGRQEENQEMLVRVQSLERSSRSRVADYVEEITSLVPNTAYLTMLRCKEDRIEVAGIADKASDLIAILEASPLFKDVSFTAPTTKYLATQGALLPASAFRGGLMRERWQALSDRERYLVLGAALLALMVVYRVRSGGDDEALAVAGGEPRWVLVQKVNGYRRIVAREKGIASQAEELNERFESQQSRLIAGATPTQVGAELQGLLSSMARDAGLNVLSTQVLREEEHGGFRRIGVRLTLSGAVTGVTDSVDGSRGW